tara:strand:- start:14553 stop:15140 length:588 start_codon:yes stop_codon:yes gene_type:complete
MSNLTIDNSNYLKYKFFNSLFLGVSVGSYITIYSPLDIKTFSIGGIFLAIAMIIIAKYYHKIININYFKKISLTAEYCILISLLILLIFSFSYSTSLAIYIIYQITFSFGSYLVRTETMLFNEKKIISKLDIIKQQGTLIGMGFSFVFYKLIENYLLIDDNETQVYYVHFVLVIVQLITIVFLTNSFIVRKHQNQ